MTPRYVAVLAAALTAPVAVVVAVPPQGAAPAIRLGSTTFRPAAGELPRLRPELSLAVYPPGQRGYYIVQGTGPITDDWKSAVTSEGAELISYIPDFAFKVRMTPSAAARVERMPSVAWVGIFQPQYKLAPGIVTDGPRAYVITIERGADTAATIALVAGAGAQVTARSGRTAIIVVDGARLPAVAHVLDVATIDNYRVPIRHNDHGGGAIMGAATAHSAGFTGASQVIAVADTGLGDGTAAGAHPHLAAARVRSIFNWPGAPGACFSSVVDDGPADVDTGHGTHVSLSALGGGGTGGEARGTAPGASLVFQAVENYAVTSALCQLLFGYNSGYYLTGVPADIGPLFTQAYTAGARVHSNSWGAGGNGAYTAQSASADDFVWRNRDLAIVFSAGNAGVDTNADGLVDGGSISAPATAKNVIAVGASENDRQGRYDCDPALTYGSCGSSGGQNTVATYGAMWPAIYQTEPLKGDLSAGNAEQMAPFSGRGPATDGRIKPDVVAPGTWVLSGYSGQFQQHYDASPNPQTGAWQYDGWGFPQGAATKYLGGTSMSTPLVSGAAAVVRDFYQQTAGHSASAALVKGTLVNSAVDLLDEDNDGVNDNRFPIPNAHEGWGRVNLAAAVDGSRVFVDDGAGLATGAATSFSQAVGSSLRPLKVTLAWSDHPSTAGAAVALVNDLDLRVTGPDGTVFLGNVFSGGWSTPGGAADRRNNLENVYVAAPSAGTWTVQVAGFNIPMGPQPFALVIDAASGPIELPPPPAAPSALAATPVSSSQVSLTWTDNSSDEQSFQIERCQGAGCTSFSLRGQAAADSTTFTDTTVAQQSTYVYRVRAVNLGGASAYSNIATATTPAAPPPPPAAPYGLIAVAASSTSIALAWGDGSADETGFQIDRCQGAGCSSFSLRAQLAANATAFSDTSLASGTSYTYRVRSINANGVSPYSNTATATTPAAPSPPPSTIPAAPSKLNATAASSTAVALAWADNSSNEQSFQIERCTGAGCGSFARIAQVGAGVTAFSDATAAAATTYSYRVRAVNSSGASAYSNIATATTPAAPPPSPIPAAPSGLIAAASSNAIALAWADKSSNEQNFQVERCTGTGCGGFAQIAQVGANVTAFNDTAVAAGTAYSYRVRAVNASGASAYSNIATAATPVAPPPSGSTPAAPSGLIAVASSSTAISLAWADNSGNEQGFRIERCTGSGCTTFAQIAQVGANVRAFQSSGLTASTLYRYRVLAFNDAGVSAASNVAQAATAAAPTSHVGDLDGSSATAGSSWSATVSVLVHNAQHLAGAAATVMGQWSSGTTGTCTTDGAGRCSIAAAQLPDTTGSVTFTVTGVTHATLVFSAAASHDPDGDSDGRAVTIVRIP